MKPVLKNSREDLLLWLKESVPEPEPVKENPLPGQDLQIVNFQYSYETSGNERRRTGVDINTATSISSLVKVPGVLASSHDRHKPVLDIDLPVKAIESSTPGHFHLYIDKEMSWDDYELLLRTLTVVGIIEPGYLEASLKRKHTSVRLPWVKKSLPPPKKRPW